MEWPMWHSVHDKHDNIVTVINGGSFTEFLQERFIIYHISYRHLFPNLG